MSEPSLTNQAPPLSVGERRERLLSTVTAFLTGAAIALLVARLGGLFSASTSQDSRHIEEWREFVGVGPRLGPKDARVTIVQFADFQCVYCRIAAVELREIRRVWPTQVAVEYRHFPVRRFAREAAVAAECANRSGLFEAYHDELYAQADSIGIKSWTKFAVEAGSHDTVAFADCLKSDGPIAVVARDSSAAARLGVNATPTFLINNLLIVGTPGFVKLYEYVAAALSDTL